MGTSQVEIYEVPIDLIKYSHTVKFPYHVRRCNGCGKQIDGDRHVTIVDGNWYCNYNCFCEHREEK